MEESFSTFHTKVWYGNPLRAESYFPFIRTESTPSLSLESLNGEVFCNNTITSGEYFSLFFKLSKTCWITGSNAALS